MPVSTPPKRGFVRQFYGAPQDHPYGEQRWKNLLHEIQYAITHPSPHIPNYTIYVLGKENHRYVEGLGAQAVLVDPRPFLYPLRGQLHRNRLTCLQMAAKDFDEFVSLDWDCHPFIPIPDNFWERLAQKNAFQAPLTRYRYSKCPWRKVDGGLVPNASWMYFRDPTIPQQFNEIYEASQAQTLSDGSEETVAAYWTDQQLGGWQGTEAYFQHFETPFILTQFSRTIFPHHLETGKHRVFCHSHEWLIEKRQARLMKSIREKPYG